MADNTNDCLSRLQAIQDEDGARLEALRQADKERQQLVTEIISKYNDLMREHRDLQADHENQKLLNRSLLGETQKRDRMIAEMRLSQESNPIVGVFIDGDGAKFQEKLIKDGIDGGDSAAHALLGEIRKDLKETYPDANIDSWEITVFIIAAMDNLAATYQRNLSQKDGFVGVDFNFELRQFAIGFNRGAHHTFNFVDVGGSRNLKELTDTKLRDTFKMMLPHCKHVFFAGCHDSGYISFLNPYKRDKQVAPRLTLIETYRTVAGFHDLGFRMTRFPDIFRTEDFPPSDGFPRTISQPQRIKSPTPLSKPARVSSISESSVNGSQTSTPGPAVTGSSWATVGKSVQPNKTIDIAPGPSKKAAAPKKYILLNKDSERINETLPPYDRTSAVRLEQRFHEQGGKKCCNQCLFFGPETCYKTNPQYRHGSIRLPPDELLVMQHKVRAIQCPQTTDCRDFDCPFSHHCRHGKQCELAHGCKWASTHHMDRTAYQRLYEDGSSEVVHS